MPTEWSLARIADVVDPTRPVTYGVVQPGDRQSAGIPLIRGKDYSSGEISGDDLYMIHPSIARAYRRSVVQGGDLLLSIVGYVGQSAVVPQKLAGANITQTTARIAIRKGLSYRYFLHQLRGLTFQREVRRYMKGSAQPGLNLSDVEQMQILVPPPLEQWRIAEILDAMDEVIRSTERLIAKLEQAKQGLLHDLLSRGIDESGHLRDPKLEPSAFVDSPVGPRPSSWSIACGLAYHPPARFRYHCGGTASRSDSGGLILRSIQFP